MSCLFTEVYCVLFATVFSHIRPRRGWGICPTARNSRQNTSAKTKFYRILMGKSLRRYCKSSDSQNAPYGDLHNTDFYMDIMDSWLSHQEIYNGATSMVRTLGSSLLVSLSKRFVCKTRINGVRYCFITSFNWVISAFQFGLNKLSNYR